MSADEGGADDEECEDAVFDPTQCPVRPAGQAQLAQLFGQNRRAEPLESFLERSQGTEVPAIRAAEQNGKRGHHQEEDDHTGEKSGDAEAAPEEVGEEDFETADRTDGMFGNETGKEKEKDRARGEKGPPNDTGGFQFQEHVFHGNSSMQGDA
jgi:hypothetical protein